MAYVWALTATLSVFQIARIFYGNGFYRTRLVLAVKSQDVAEMERLRNHIHTQLKTTSRSEVLVVEGDADVATTITVAPSVEAALWGIPLFASILSLV